MYNPGNITLEIEWEKLIPEDFKKQVSCKTSKSSDFSTDDTIVMRPKTAANIKRPMFCGRKLYRRPLSGNGTKT